MFTAKQKKPIRKGHTLYNSYYVTFRKIQTIGTEKGSVVVWEEESEHTGHRELGSWWNSLYDIMTVGICHSTLIKTQRYTREKAEVGSVGAAEMWEAVHVWGEDLWEICSFHSVLQWT